MAAPLHLIVTGIARSGTTALAELLNSHEQICVGIERFKFQYLHNNFYSADLFEKDRFFDFRPEDTNLRPAVRPDWQETYDIIARKWDGAAVIGDKVPDLTLVLQDMLTQNPDFKCLYILRNLKDVGLSWQARANRTRDSWPAGKGFVAACASWQTQSRALFDLMVKKDFNQRILLLDYDSMYEPGNQTAAAILKFLGVGPSASYSQTFRRHAVFARQRKPTILPEDYLEAFVAVDKSFARKMRKRSMNQIDRVMDVHKPAW